MKKNLQVCFSVMFGLGALWVCIVASADDKPKRDSSSKDDGLTSFLFPTTGRTFLMNNDSKNALKDVIYIDHIDLPAPGDDAAKKAGEDQKTGSARFTDDRTLFADNVTESKKDPEVCSPTDTA